MTYLLDNFKWIEVNIHYEGVSFNSSRIRQGVVRQLERDSGSKFKSNCPKLRNFKTQ